MAQGRAAHSDGIATVSHEQSIALQRTGGVRRIAIRVPTRYTSSIDQLKSKLSFAIKRLPRNKELPLIRKEYRALCIYARSEYECAQDCQTPSAYSCAET